MAHEAKANSSDIATSKDKSKAEERFDALVDDYDCTSFFNLPKVMRRRVDALKKIQLEHIQIQHVYHKELQELELKYEKLYAPLYEKRYKIINGEHEPTDEECQLPASIIEDEFNGDQENNPDDVTQDSMSLTPQQEEAIKSKIVGVPGFWLGCLASTYNFNDSIEDYDKKVLRHLKDIKLSYGEKDEHLTYTLDFYFGKNPYFSNETLTKTYFLKLKPDEKDPFAYEGFEVFKSEGCDINWLPGKDVTTKIKVVKQQNKKDGRMREKKKELERDSFFYFFKPPQLSNKEEELDEELGAIMAVDFELGEVVRQSIIPKAVLYYAGYMMDDDEDDEDDDLDDEDEDSDDELSDSDQSDDSDDSLSDNKAKKKPVKKSPKDAC